MLSNRNPLDPFLGIKHKAWMILHALQVNEPLKKAIDQAFHVETFAFYNGRETCIGIQVEGRNDHNKPANKRRLILYFGEHRSSDAIFVQHTTWSGGINPPTIANFDEESYNQRRCFNCNALDELADYVVELVEAHLAPEDGN